MHGVPDPSLVSAIGFLMGKGFRFEPAPSGGYRIWDQGGNERGAFTDGQVLREARARGWSPDVERKG